MVIAVGACYPVWLRRLQQAGIVSAGFELDLMLEEGFAISKAQRLAHPERELTPEEVARMQGWLVRREAGEPLQYLLGWWEFYGRRFAVGPGVLIPRADTETLVEQVLKQLEGVPSPQVADLCAGSGCVGLTIACERPDAEVALVELSPEAGEYCASNIRALAPRCRLIQADVLKSTAVWQIWTLFFPTRRIFHRVTCLGCSGRCNGSLLWRWTDQAMGCVFTVKFLFAGGGR